MDTQKLRSTNDLQIVRFAHKENNVKATAESITPNAVVNGAVKPSAPLLPSALPVEDDELVDELDELADEVVDEFVDGA